MAYAIINDFISQSLYKLKAPYTMVPEFITIHNTYNDATALNEIAYMTRNTTVVGYHAAIDEKHVIQAIPFNRNAFHAGDGGNGDGNRKSIGIEICYSKSGGAKYVAAEANTVEYVAQLLKKYGWGFDRVRSHKSWTEIGFKTGASSYIKNCPHRILDEKRWQTFLNRIEARLKVLNTPQTKEEDEVFNSGSSTINKEVVATIVAARKAGILTADTYVVKAQNGTLTLQEQSAINTLILKRAYLDTLDK